MPTSRVWRCSARSTSTCSCPGRRPRDSPGSRRPTGPTRAGGSARSSTGCAREAIDERLRPTIRFLMARVYVTGHRNPDTDSVAAAIGYAELKGRNDPNNEYVPARLGDVNDQTAWVLDRAGADEPVYLPHIMLRVRDVMRHEFPIARSTEAVRDAGLRMASEDLELVPIVGEDGALEGVLTERALARRYVRESQEASELDAPTRVGAIADVLGADVAAGDRDKEVAGRVW